MDGASVHDVAQTVATASVVGPTALAAAVVVKLTRVVLLAPLVAGVSLWWRRNETAVYGTRRPPLVPLFVVGFLAMVGLRTTGVVPSRCWTSRRPSNRSCWPLPFRIGRRRAPSNARAYRR